MKNPREGVGLLVSSAAFAGNTGVITSLNEGYGFIAPRMGGPALFFHYSDLKNRRFAAVQVEDAVEFELGQNRQGECAKRVRVV